MARPLRIEYPGAFYHIIQRGNDRKNIFLTEQDRNRFYGYLKTLRERYAVALHCYCLMDNHYHLIVGTERANIAKAMHFLNTSYTVYFNTKNKRAGHLFQGRYKSVLVEADAYLHFLSAYIHLNPVRARIVENPLLYPHSSYKYFVAKNNAPEWLDVNFILAMFDKNAKKARTLYEKFVTDQIGREKEEIQRNTTAGFLLGSEEFVETIKERFLGGKVDAEIPALKKIKTCPQAMTIRAIAEERIKNKKLSRNVVIYLARKYTGDSLKDIARMYGDISDAGVSALYYRMEERISGDEELRGIIVDISKMLKIET